MSKVLKEIICEENNGPYDGWNYLGTLKRLNVKAAFILQSGYDFMLPRWRFSIRHTLH